MWAVGLKKSGIGDYAKLIVGVCGCVDRRIERGSNQSITMGGEVLRDCQKARGMCSATVRGKLRSHFSSSLIAISELAPLPDT
jgi:hypothetical protein